MLPRRSAVFGTRPCTNPGAERGRAAPSAARPERRTRARTPRSSSGCPATQLPIPSAGRWLGRARGHHRHGAGAPVPISTKEGQPLAECPGDCRLSLAPGRYKIFVHETPGTLAGSREVDISAPTTLRVDPDTQAHRSVGLGLGIAGPILMLVSLGVLLANACIDCGDSGRRTTNNTRPRTARRSSACSAASPSRRSVG